MGGQAIIGSARLIIYPKDILSVEGGRFERWRLGSLNLPRDGADGRHEKKKMRHVLTSLTQRPSWPVLRLRSCLASAQNTRQDQARILPIHFNCHNLSVIFDFFTPSMDREHDSRAPAE